MAKFIDRTGDFTKKKYLYKFYKNGYTSRKPKYVTAGQYIGSTSEITRGGLTGNAQVSGSFSENGATIYASGDSNTGLSIGYKISTDPRRRMDLKGIVAKFTHAGGPYGMGALNFYEISFFDYRIRYTASGNTLKVFYKSSEIASVTKSSNYDHLRMREIDGKLYIDRSSNGSTWTAWVNKTIDFDNDIVRSQFSFEADGGAGGTGGFSASLFDIDISDRQGQLLAVESNALSELEYAEQVNNPASATTIDFPYNPNNLPAHCKEGNFIEIYANFYDDGAIRNEPILDHNGAPILDENNAPITGIVLHENIPEEASVLKFSGYISALDYDFDNETVAITFTSHGESIANSMVKDEFDELVEVISQTQKNASIGTSSTRQTFTLTKMTKIDMIKLRVSHGGGGGTSVSIGRGISTVLAFSRSYNWSGPLPETDFNFEFLSSVYLEAGTYWLEVSGGITWYYQNSDVLSSGSLQQQSGGGWGNITGDAFMVLMSRQPDLQLEISGDSVTIANKILARSLALDYSPLYLEEVQQTDYHMNISLNMDSAKNALNALYRQLPSGWFWSVNIGTGAIRIKDKSKADHLFVFGRDFTQMKLTKDINGIINDVYYVGGQLVENGPKLTTRFFDNESIDEYRLGVSIMTNDKVTRYDSAQLLSENNIRNNNKPRLTTAITISASKYNTETVRTGDVVKIVNGDPDLLGTTLVVADIDYNPDSITISLDSSPRNLSRTIDAINRQLENLQTAGAGAVV